MHWKLFIQKYKANKIDLHIYTKIFQLSISPIFSFQFVILFKHYYRSTDVIFFIYKH